MSGVTTHAVRAVRILDKDAADSPEFIPLLKDAKRYGFTISEVSADKAYASFDNFEEIAACGAQGYIAFKSNHTGAVGGHFEKAFHMFQAFRDENLAKYHLRSNVESDFSAVTRKFSPSVMSLTDTAMTNECLAKFLCQYLSMLVQVEERLGLTQVFWKNEPVEEDDEAPAVVPMAQPG
jgi:hypothetical protein